MLRLSSIRVAVILILTAGFAGAQPSQFSRVFVTVTNKADYELSLSLTLDSIAQTVSPTNSSTNPAPFHVQRIVKPREQTTFTIPKGNYIVEAITAPKPDHEAIPQKLDSSNERTNVISNNEIWTFELEKEPSPGADNSQPAEKSPALHTWKRHIWPVRQPRESHSGLPAPSPPQPPAPPGNLRVIDPTPP